MASIKVLVAEDEPAYQLQLEIFLKKLAYEIIGIVDNTQEAFKLFKENQVDVALIDIVLRDVEKDGIDLVEKFNQIRKIPVIYLSSSIDENTLQRAKKTQPSAYLTKPYGKIDLQNAIDLALDNFASREKQHIFIKIDNNIQKVNLEDIYFIEVVNKHILIEAQEQYVMRMSLQEFKEKINDYSNIIQVHRSCLINLDKIEKVDLEKNTICIRNSQITIGRKFRKNLLEKLKMGFNG